MTTGKEGNVLGFLKGYYNYCHTVLTMIEVLKVPNLGLDGEEGLYSSGFAGVGVGAVGAAGAAGAAVRCTFAGEDCS